MYIYIYIYCGGAVSRWATGWWMERSRLPVACLLTVAPSKTCKFIEHADVYGQRVLTSCRIYII